MAAVGVERCHVGEWPVAGTLCGRRQRGFVHTQLCTPHAMHTPSSHICDDLVLNILDFVGIYLCT